MNQKFFRASILLLVIIGNAKLFGKTNAGIFERKFFLADPIILIYPDSSCSNYFISTGEEYKNQLLDLTIFDLSGRELFTQKIQGASTAKISANNFSDGIYFLRLATDRGIICNRKIIVHHYL